MTTVITYHTVKQSHMTIVITRFTVKQSPMTTVIFNLIKVEQKHPLCQVGNNCNHMQQFNYILGNNCSHI
jgi:hypothetical protein